MKIGKKNIIAFSLAFIMATTFVGTKLSHSSDVEITINQEIDDPNYFRSSSCGDVYIGNAAQIRRLQESGVEGIFVVDERAKKDDSNMKVVDSTRVWSKQEMTEILTILNEYNEIYPSKWNRTIKSMINEWYAHNICYIGDYYSDNAKDVDLNNDDEEVFKEIDLKKIYIRKKKLENNN